MDLSTELFDKSKNYTIVYSYNDSKKAFHIMLLIDGEYFKSTETMIFNNKYDCVAVTGEDLNYTDEEAKAEMNNRFDEIPPVELTFKLGKKYKMSNGEITGVIVKATKWDEFEAVRELDYKDGTYRWDYEGKNPITDYDLVEPID